MENGKLLILAMDSSAKAASVAVCKDNALLGQYFQNNGLTHSKTLLSMTKDLLKNLDVSIEDIDLIAVSSGPGSFTGVRIGVAAAKGLAWGADKPVCGVSPLEAMAYQLQEPNTTTTICAVMDARRNQVYNALFELKGGTLLRQCQDRAISLEDLAAELQNIGSPVCLVGDGAEISYEYLSAADIPCKLAPQLLRDQTAFGAALAAIHAIQTTATALEPSYLRPPQAEREKSQYDKNL